MGSNFLKAAFRSPGSMLFESWVRLTRPQSRKLCDSDSIEFVRLGKQISTNPFSDCGMTLEEAAGRMLGALTAAGIPHMLVGGFTSNFYGIPRATKDVDIVIHLAHKGQLSGVA